MLQLRLIWAPTSLHMSQLGVVGAGSRTPLPGVCVRSLSLTTGPWWQYRWATAITSQNWNNLGLTVLPWCPCPLFLLEMSGGMEVM